MAYKVATTVKQAAWECRWARAGRRLRPDPDRGHPEETWICVRPTVHGDRRLVVESECEGCEHWETLENRDNFDVSMNRSQNEAVEACHALRAGGMPPANPSPARSDEKELRIRVQAEFREMPGLRLTLPQAARLFGIEQPRCERLLDGLVRAGSLAADRDAFCSRPSVRITRFCQRRTFQV